MKIIWCDFKKEEEKEIRSLKDFGISVILFENSFDQITFLESPKINEIEGIVFSYVNTKVEASILASFQNLKFIITRSTGCEHIDLNYCKQRKIKVCNIKGYSTIATAEYTIALMFSLLRNLKTTLLRTNQGIFLRERGEELRSKIVGVVGTGSIGSEVVKLLRGMGVKVLCWSFREKEELKSLNAIYVKLEELLRNSDIITFHLRLSDKTYHFFNKRSLEIVKKGVYIVNTSRGEIIDLKVLYEGVQSGIIAGAALDCFEEEDYFLRGEAKKDLDYEKVAYIKELIKHPKIIFTPHNAFNTFESQRLDLKYTIKNLINLKVKGKCLTECI